MRKRSHQRRDANQRPFVKFIDMVFRRSEAFDALKRRVLASLDASMLPSAEPREQIVEGAGMWW
jgi:hypothetical protein